MMRLLTRRPPHAFRAWGGDGCLICGRDRRNRMHRATCGTPGRDHGGIRNPCVRPAWHRFGRHRDMWGDKW